MWPVLAGFVGGLLLTTVVAAADKKKLEQRGVQIAALLQSGGNDAQLYMLARGAAAQEKLQFIGDKRARELAEATANKYIGQAYGLTAARIEKLQRLQEWV